MQAVVLASGGVDSSLILKMLKDRRYDLYSLHINYGQLANDHEWASLQLVCKLLDLRPPHQFDLSGYAEIPSALTNPRLDLATQAFLPTRNLMFLVTGGAYAASRGISTLAIGLVANPLFPDQTEEFVKAAEAAIKAAVGTPLVILAPLIKLDKRAVLEMARSVNVPLKATYYCHSGQEWPCEKCISCQERMAAEKSIIESRKP